MMTHPPTQEAKERFNPQPQQKTAAAGVSCADAANASQQTAVKSFLNWVRDLWSAPKQKGQPLGWRANTFIALQVLFGFPMVLYAILHWRPEDTLRFACFFALAMAASVFKVRLPGIEATMSANFVFILVSILDFSFSETLMIGCLGGLAQSLWQAKPRPRPIQMLFNFANLALSISAANYVFHSAFAYQHGLRWPLLLGAASTTYFVVNTMSVSGIIAITQKRRPIMVWKECYLWSFPYYLLGAMIAGGMSVMNRVIGWQVAILVLPIVYWIYRSYRTYLDRLEAEKTHSTEIAELHLRTIEALSLAIEAKDHNTHAHLNRVQAHALQLGKDLEISQADLNALRAASLLHDIGKLAVPEQILSKPGLLTQEEFEKMKIHPTIGAEILKRVQFPYPVVPVVLSHHEKWDGTGYPNALRGEDIPIGARILSVVDCFDALTSERPYRRGMSTEDAMKHILAESGISFDPRVVGALEKRCVELNQPVEGSEVADNPFRSLASPNPSTVPSSGIGEVPKASEVRTTSFLASIISARQEAQLLFELAQTLGNSLSLRETLSVVAVRLKEMIPHDLIVFYVYDQGKLVPRHVHGVDYELFSSLEIPIGQGIAGWVAENKEPIINGEPAAESKYLADPTRVSILKSALSVPLDGREGVAGVLSLYRREKDAFTKDQLRMLLAATSKLGLSMENALQFESARDSAGTDFLTGLPNARSICAHLSNELGRSIRSQQSLAVLLCDLNGFKDVNDNFGHLIGNKLLQETAKNLLAVCRDYDLVGRFGGDEFVLILPQIDAKTVMEFLPRLELAVEEASRVICGNVAVTASIGAAFHPQNGVTAEELLSEADRTMYVAKEDHYKKQKQAPRSQLADALTL
jgi:diguanylate cyclase (GGDEF)-like protein/putative nucleotidyltransferase with HDIG domain